MVLLSSLSPAACSMTELLWISDTGFSIHRMSLLSPYRMPMFWSKCRHIFLFLVVKKITKELPQSSQYKASPNDRHHHHQIIPNIDSFLLAKDWLHGFPTASGTSEIFFSSLVSPIIFLVMAQCGRLSWLYQLVSALWIYRYRIMSQKLTEWQCILCHYRRHL